MNLLPPPADLTRAFLAGDAQYDGVFYAGITTTGIFCRPSCPARKPRPEHLEFFATPAQAVTAGYRACRRCDPTGAIGLPPAWVAPLLERIEREPAARVTQTDLEELGIDPTRARRWFLRHHGLTFSEYARSRRLQSAQEKLQAGVVLDDVALGTGWDSHSGFREAYGREFGGPPGSRRQGGAIVTRVVASPLGPLRLAATSAGICLVEFHDPARLEAQRQALQRWLGLPVLPGNHPHLDRLESELGEYFAGTRRDFTVPLVAPGTGFQTLVWDALCKIPYGETRSYAALAASVGRPKAQRAVGLANGNNRIAIVIPCHRVVNTGGALGGYGGGVWRKHWLLELERPTAA